MPSPSRPAEDQTPRNRAAQVTDGVTGVLLAMIQDGTLGQDERLPPERVLAAQLGVSRTSLREALHELELKGLIDRRPGRGTIVVDPGRGGMGESLLGHMEEGERGLREVMDLRGVIEPPIAGRAAQRATANDIEAMRAILEQMRGEATAPRVGAARHRVPRRHRARHPQPAARAAHALRVGVDRRGPAPPRRAAAAAASARSARTRRSLARIEARDADGAALAMARHIAEVNE